MADPRAIQQAAARFVARRLGVNRAFYGNVEADGEHVAILEDYHEGLESSSGLYHLAEFGPAVLEAFRRGHTLAVEDVAAELSLTEAERAAFENLGVRAHATIFLRKDAEVVALFGVGDGAPRAWTVTEIALLEETAERTWTAVTQAQPEAALRRSEERLRLALDAAGMGSFLWYPEEDRAESDRQMLELFGLGSEAELTLAEAMATFIHPDDRDRYAAGVGAAIAPGGDGQLREEIRVIHPDESMRWLVVTARVEFGGIPRRALRMAGVAEDVSETKAAERVLAAVSARNAVRAALSDALRRLTDPRELQGEITRVLGEHLRAQRVLYCETVPGAEYVVAADNYSNGVVLLVGSIELETHGPAVLAALRDGRTVVDRDVDSNPELSADDRAAYAAIGVGAQVAVPLLADGRLAAILAVHQDSPREWTAEEVILIEETAERTRAALDRARAETALRESESHERRRREQVELLDTITQALEVVEGVRGRVEELLQQIVPRIADHASVAIPDLGGPVERGREVSEVTTRLEFGAVFPGTLTLGFSKAGALLPTAEHTFLAQLAERAGLLLASAHIRQQEHRIAVRLQRALLPNRVLEHRDVIIAARYEPRSETLEVGGDWYDSFLLPDGRIGLAVGDVVGHGIDAAAGMGRLRTALSALAARTESAGELISHLDSFAGSPNGVDLATACYAILEPAGGELRYASAGHPPVLLREPGRGTRWLLEGRSPPLGTLLEMNRPEAVDVLAPDALLVLYSDGLVEHRDATITVGLSRLEAVVSGLSDDVHVDEACTRILVEMGVATDRRDDVVVMCLRFSPSRPAPAQAP